MSKDSLKKGADYILKGGTLLKDPCQICNGLLVKFKGNIVCINCQEKQNFEIDKKENQSGLPEYNQNGVNSKKIVKTKYQDLLNQIEETIIEKLNKNNELIKIENDINKQIDYLKTLRLYLKVLKEIKTIYKIN
ncbi:MAG TPA: Sjogren's syndrome/scleroderma autoantigen 1 family protein [Candidatus Nitrosocosmicus sp.]